jgi:head-tail adaptor
MILPLGLVEDPQENLRLNSIQATRSSAFDPIIPVIPLHRTQFPNSKSELAEAMDDSLRRYVHKEGPLVTINARVFPYLDEIAINFDGARLDPKLPPFTKAVGETRHACEAAVVKVSGRNVSIQGAPLQLQLTASDLVFDQGRDEKGEALLLVKSIRTGHFVVSVAQSDLEKAIRELAEREGARQGISIEETRVSLRARGSRSIAADVRLRARKFLFRTNIDISGQVDIDDQFNARVSNLKCRGDGTVGSLACGVLEPHLQRLEGHKFSLMSFPLGELKLRDVRIAVADTVEITADFGSAASA